MAKIDPSFESPLDNFIVYNICEPISESIYKFNITPNMITTLSFACSLISIYFLYNYNILFFIIFSSLNYIFDCLDGYVARKYKLTTKFGDYFDHFTDIIHLFLIMFVLFYRYNFFDFKIALVFSICLLLLYMITLSCQEKIMKKQNRSKVLSYGMDYCNLTLQRNMKYLRIFGSATMNLYIILLVIYLYSSKIKLI